MKQVYWGAMKLILLPSIFGPGAGIARERSHACRTYKPLVEKVMHKYQGEQYEASTMRKFVSKNKYLKSVLVSSLHLYIHFKI